MLCVTSDSDFEKLYTFYCLLSVEGFFLFSCKFPDSHLSEDFGSYMSCQVQRGSL